MVYFTLSEAKSDLWITLHDDCTTYLMDKFWFPEVKAILISDLLWINDTVLEGIHRATVSLKFIDLILVQVVDRNNIQDFFEKFFKYFCLYIDDIWWTFL